MLIPIEGTPYPTNEITVDFSVTFGAAVITKADADTAVDCENEPTKGWIQLVKVDALDRTPIAGVGFDIYSGGKLISSMTTDEKW